MNDEDARRLQLEVNRLSGVMEEIQERLHDVEGKLSHTHYRLFKIAIMTGAGFAVLLGAVGAIYLMSLY